MLFSIVYRGSKFYVPRKSSFENFPIYVCCNLNKVLYLTSITDKTPHHHNLDSAFTKMCCVFLNSTGRRCAVVSSSEGIVARCSLTLGSSTHARVAWRRWSFPRPPHLPPLPGPHHLMVAAITMMMRSWKWCLRPIWMRMRTTRILTLWMIGLTTTLPWVAPPPAPSCLTWQRDSQVNYSVY